MPDFLLSGPASAKTTLLLAHGAGAPMDSSWMNGMAEALAEREVRTARFEFSYMAARRAGEGRKPIPRADKVMPEFLAAVEALASPSPLFIGGKSMGGRVASMVAETLFRARRSPASFASAIHSTRPTSRSNFAPRIWRRSPSPR